MRRTFVAISLAAFAFSGLFASSAHLLDSLRSELGSGSPPGRWDAAIALAKHFSYAQPQEDSALHYLRYYKAEWEQNEAHSFLTQYWLLKAKLLARRLNASPTPSARDTVFSCYRFSGRHALLAGDSLEYARALTGLATQFDRNRQVDSSAHYFLQTIRIYEKRAHPRIAMAYFYLAAAFAKERESDLAFSYRKKAWDAYQKLGGEVWKAMPIAEGLAESYQQLFTRDSSTHHLDSSFHFLNMALNTAKQLNQEKHILRFEMAIAQNLRLMERWEASLKMGSEVLQKTRGSWGKMEPSGRELCQAYLNQSHLFAERGASHRAALYADSAAMQADSMAWLAYQAEAYLLKYQSQKKLGQYPEALLALERHKQFQDSLNSAERHKVITDLESRYQSAKKEKENMALVQSLNLKAQTLRQRTLMLIIAVAGFLLIVLAGLLHYHQRQRKQEQKHSQIKDRLLRAQINPHFFFNVLTSLQNRVLSSESPLILAKLLSQLAKLMRQTLENSFQDRITLTEEIELLQTYLDLQKNCSGIDFSYEISLPEMDREKVWVPPMLIQPLVENALKHGMPKNQVGKIHINFTLDSQILAVEVRDNGPGLDSQKLSLPTEHRSRAQQIIQERLQLLPAHKSKSFTMKTVYESGSIAGTLSEIHIPFPHI